MRGSAASAAGKRTIAAHSESWQEGSVQRVVRQDEETRMDVGRVGCMAVGLGVMLGEQSVGSHAGWESSMWVALAKAQETTSNSHQ